MNDASYTSPWIAAIASGTLILLVSAAGLWVTRNDIATSNQKQNTQAREMNDALSNRIGKLESLPVADPTGKATLDAAISPLNERIVSLEAQLAAAEARIETLENAPPPPPAVPAVVSPAASAPAAPTEAALTPPAPVSVPNDTARMEQFRAIVASLPKPADEAGSTAQKINERFAGLITIHKPAPDQYVPLRNAASIGEARAAIATLPVEKQTPFATWLAALDAPATPPAPSAP